MEHPSQQQMAQPSREMIEGLPAGYPPKRVHLHDVDPLASDLQRRLDEIGKQNFAECPEGSQAGAYFSKV